MATFTITVADPAYGTQRFYTVARFALAARHEQHDVNVFLYEDAVGAAKKNQETADFPGVLQERMPHCGELIAALVRAGVRIKACGICAKERGLAPQEVVDGVEIGSMVDLARWVDAADKVIAF
jgi:uncharacterized protein involved in oxidation of intracellular sulfur